MISVVYPYYNLQKNVHKHVEAWKQWDHRHKSEVEVIIVDDGSELYPIDKDWFKGTIPNLRFFRIDENIPWNNPGASNLGALKSSHERILLLDFEYVVNYRTLAYLPRQDHKDKLFPATRYDSTRRIRFGTPHCNSFMMYKEDFLRLGGFDESYSGNWGFFDSMFTAYSKFKGYREVYYGQEWEVFWIRNGNVSEGSAHKLRKTGPNESVYSKHIKNLASYKPKPMINFDWKEL